MFRLRPDWGVAKTTEDYAIFANEDQVFRVKAEPALLQAFLSGLGSQQIGPGDSAVDNLAQALAEAGVLHQETEDTLGKEDQLSRMYEYFACFHPRPESLIERIQTSHVMILGLGGSGTVVLQNLVATGVRHFTLLDSDTVALSNLNRQLIYRRSDIGRLKTDVCREYVYDRLDHALCTVQNLKLSSRDDVLGCLGIGTPPDVVVVAVDTPIESIVHTVTDALSERDVPYIVAGVGIRYGRAGSIRKNEVDARKFSGTTASLATTNSISASYTAHRVVEHLCGISLSFQLRDLE